MKNHLKTSLRSPTIISPKKNIIEKDISNETSYEKLIRLKKKFQKYENDIINNNKLSDNEIKWLLQYMEKEILLFKTEKNIFKETLLNRNTEIKSIIDKIKDLKITPNINKALDESKLSQNFKEIYKDVSDKQRAIIEVTKKIIKNMLIKDFYQEYFITLDKILNDIKDTIDGEGYKKAIGLKD